ncbi:SusC/RagA family TonB-linked outer membrane protein [Flexithrix dorotheae]|uniref:SusC/RagA family TonB-linked outer membrane protein n=1 Tax=Flexithrix dorotheae TaxID=70993 RepID=UPI000476C288|nr:SusC/RagA family TonB-linked outer membrane protein [Flexithrix dorotheae]
MKLKLLRQILIMSRYLFYGIIFQCLMAGLLIAKESNAQRKSIEEVILSVDLKNATLKEAFALIANKTDFKFAYDNRKIDTNQRISTAIENESLADLLRHISKSSDLRFKRVNDNIFVSKKNIFEAPVAEELEDNFEILQTVISGTVISGEDDLPLPGVSVIIKGTSTGTTTDLDGKFSLNVEESSVLSFSYIGFETQEIEVGNRSTFNITLKPDLAQLDEVVVVGYGTVKKSDLTGSVSSVKSEDLTAYPAIGTVQALQGRAAGVQITSNNGEPGASYKVRVRGGTSINASSDPIYVVDGFVGAALPPPEDIESIEVLKDASATAIYGSRGANGVIMVTTKRGKAGKTNVDFNASYSVQNEINRLELLKPDDFVNYIQEASDNPNFTSLGSNTDWQDVIFQPGNIQNYQLGLSGGSDNVNYYVSGTLYDQKGIIINSGYKRYSVTSNIDIKASEKFKFGLNLFARRTDKEGARTQEGSGGANNSGVVAAAFKMGPDQPIRNSNGVYTLARLSDPHDNAYAIATEYVNENVTDRFQGNLYGEYDIFKDLKFRLTLGASSDNGRTGEYTPTVLQGGAGVGGDGRINSYKNSLLLNENYLTYNKDIGNHNFSVMAGYSYQKSRNESWGGRGQGFPTDAGLYWNLDGSAVWQSPNSNLNEWELSSWYGRVNYNFNSKYLLTFNARYDGSSVFSEGKKWAFFPSGAFAWNMKEENFMNGLDVVSNWKWRVSYGLTGNRAIGPYQTLAQLSPVLTVQNGAPVNAVAPTSVANRDLSWETTAQFDIGIDVGLLEDRINIIMDYYAMETSDLLFSVPLPEYSGYGSQLKNIGKVENKGFEFTLSSRNLVGEFKWNMDFNISANRNKVLELPNGGIDIQYASGPGHMVGLGNTQILREGEPVGSFFGWIYDGPYQDGDEILPGGGFETEVGGEKYRDIDGTKDENGDLTGVPDGQLNADDRTIIGDPNPNFIWGFNNDFSYKGFDLNIFFQASQGNDIYSYTLMELDLMAGRNNATTAALNRWTPQNTNTDVPKAFGGRSRRASTRWIYDGSFVRLKNLALGYNFPTQITEKMGIRKFRLYVSAQNILTFTDYEGYDPEVNYRTDGSTNGNRNLGLDYASYPNAKSYTVGLNIGF